jgi:hypothetical protein
VVPPPNRNGRIHVQILNTRINRNPLDVMADVSFSKVAKLDAPPRITGVRI